MTHDNVLVDVSNGHEFVGWPDAWMAAHVWASAGPAVAQALNLTNNGFNEVLYRPG